MIRFASKEDGTNTIISIAGRLEAGHLAELEAHCAEAQQAVVLDLSELQSADEASIRWLCDYVEKDARVTAASPYIKLRLERAGECSRSAASLKQPEETDNEEHT